jgi:hypothetical protein
MDDVRFAELEFTVGRCDHCGRDVLTYPDPDGPEDGANACCVHCATVVIGGLRAARGDDLPAHGYGLLETQGCGNPACGGGQCSRRQNEA